MMLMLVSPVASALLLCGLNCGAVCAQSSEGKGMTQQTFAEVVDSTGEVYVRARSKLLSEEGVEEFLDKVSKDTARPDDVRWLAEILLTRMRKPQEFEKLEEDFAAKAGLPLSSGHILGGLHFGPARLPEQEIPTIEELEKRLISPSVQNYYRSKQLVKSPLWGPVTGEVLLKGWIRTPDLPAGEDYGYLGPDGKPFQRRGPGLGGLPVGTVMYVSHWVYLQSAICVLGHLREQRARLPIEKMLRDSKQHELVRVEAAIALYRLGDQRSVDVLADVARNRKQGANVRQVVLPVLANLAGARALPVLEELSARGAADPAVSDRALDLKLHIQALPKQKVHIPHFEN